MTSQMVVISAQQVVLYVVFTAQPINPYSNKHYILTLILLLLLALKMYYKTLLFQMI
jgi:hypothetical protein